MNEKFIQNLDKLPADVRREFALLANKYGEKKKQDTIQTDFLSFVKHVWPDFIEGSHHKRIADKFNKLASGEIKRLIINMPPRHTKSELEGVKASLTAGKWNAQWMQNPTAEEGSIIKREWWRLWEKPAIPPLQHIIQSYDTAFSKKETADYSAITTWGVFHPDDDSPPNLILLDAHKERLEFPELRKEALEQYKYWRPDTVIIEAKASGQPLTYELRKIGIPVINFTPSKGQDKFSRVASVAPMFESGIIWAPDEEYADEVIEECASFPYGDHDDLVDSTTQALMRFRQGGFINLPDDYKEDPLPRTEKEYY